MKNNDLKVLRKLISPGYKQSLSGKCEKYIDCIFRDERIRVDLIDEAIKMAKEYQVPI